MINAVEEEKEAVTSFRGEPRLPDSITLGSPIGVTVVKVDLVGHQQGTRSSPGAAVSETDEDDPRRLILYDNDDDDNGDSAKDKSNTSIEAADNDIVKITLKQPCSGIKSGVMTLSVTPSDALHVFKSSGTALLKNFSVNFASPSGDLAALATGDVDLYVEGIKPHLDVCIKVTFSDPGGTEICSDEAHLVSSFELILRRQIVQAANDQSGCGIKFSWGGRLANCDPGNACERQVERAVFLPI